MDELGGYITEAREKAGGIMDCWNLGLHGERQGTIFGKTKEINY